MNSRRIFSVFFSFYPLAARFARKWAAWPLALLLALLPAFCPAAEDAPLRLGIMPFNSTLALIKSHQPLTRYLEAQLGRKVAVYTSTDYYTYVNELLDGQFDLAIAGPHFGSIAQERGAVLLFRYRADLQPVFVVRTDSPIRTVEDLRGLRIGLSSPLSISSIGGVKWMQEHGLKLGRDFQLVERTTHGAAVAAVAVGEVDAALTTHTPLKQIPDNIRSRIRPLPLDIHIPHLMTLANPKLGTAAIERLRQALRRFPDSPEGREFFQETGYVGYVDITPADLQAIRPYKELTLQMMRQGR
jgi:phosphonate transport system substrate-binding protein